MKLTFQRAKAVGLSATYHFIFTGKEPHEATIRIHERTLTVDKGLAGTPDCVCARRQRRLAAVHPQGARHRQPEC